MSFKGEIQPNDANNDAFEELFEAVVNWLAGDKTQLAVWLIQDDIDFSLIEPQPIGAQSPFPESDSVLAGSGLLIKLNLRNVENVIQLFTANGRLKFEILHIQIESNGSVQFATYDHFGYVLFGDEISIKMLETLKSRDVIDSYKLWDEPT
ncbi:MAG: hypothetical protein AB1589_26605 [Cyanobacteriota bacterium]